MRSSCELSLNHARKLGYKVGVVERSVEKKHSGGGTFKSDLFGILDIIAVKPGEPPTGIQATTKSGFYSHRTKIHEAETLPCLMAAGWRIELHAWCKEFLKERGAEVWVPRVEVWEGMADIGELGL